MVSHGALRGRWGGARCSTHAYKWCNVHQGTCGKTSGFEASSAGFQKGFFNQMFFDNILLLSEVLTICKLGRSDMFEEYNGSQKIDTLMSPWATFLSGRTNMQKFR